MKRLLKNEKPSEKVFNETKENAVKILLRHKTSVSNSMADAISKLENEDNSLVKIMNLLSKNDLNSLLNSVSDETKKELKRRLFEDVALSLMK